MAQVQEPPPAVERDPREGEAWFQELPPAEQARLRQRWDERASRDEQHFARDRRLLLRTMAECAALFALVLLLVLSWRQVVTWRNLLFVPAAGAAAGFLLHNWLRDQYGATLAGMAGVLVLAWQSGPSVFQLLAAVVAGTVAFGWYGLRRHFRALDGMQ